MITGWAQKAATSVRICAQPLINVGLGRGRAARHAPNRHRRSAPGLPGRPGILSNLGITLQTLGEHVLDEGAAVAAAHEDHPDRAR